MYGSVDPASPDDGVKDLGDVAARLAPTASLQKIGNRLQVFETSFAATAKQAFSLRDLPVLILPWFIFSMTMLPIAVMDESFLGYLSLLTTVLLSTGFIVFSQGTPWMLLACVCFAAAVLGEGVGQYDRIGLTTLRTLYGNSPASSYDNVLPTQNPQELKDGIFFTFSDDTKVDFTKGVGYHEDKVWCVAPVVNTDMQDRVGFFAVGHDCCRDRGFFHCGDIFNTSKLSGLLELNQARHKMYMKAAKMAAQTYGFVLEQDPIFLRWDETPEGALQDLTSRSITIAVISLVLSFIGVPASLIILNLTGVRLIKDEPRVVKEMIIGFEWHPKPYSNELMLDLMNHRSYWSGVIMYDYIFHIANKHIFLGPLFCHPAHPFSKKERLVVLTINVLLIIFPVAAMTTKFGKDSMTRTILVAILVTIPRNLLKLYLIDLSMEDEEMELEGQAVSKAKVREVQQNEMFFLTAAIVISIVTGVVCTVYIKAHTDKSLLHVLAENTDGVAFGFILEFLFDLLVPYYTGPPKHEKIAFGFFGRWYLEYEDFSAGADFSAGKASLKTMEPLQPMVQSAPSAPPARLPGGSAQELLSMRQGD